MDETCLWNLVVISKTIFERESMDQIRVVVRCAKVFNVLVKNLIDFVVASCVAMLTKKAKYFSLF